MPQRRRFKFAVLGALASGLAGAGVMVGAGLAVGPNSLPDLTVMLPDFGQNPNRRWVDTYEAPGRVLYRFDSVIGNEGPGTLDVYRVSSSAPATFQAIWDSGLPPGEVNPPDDQSAPVPSGPVTSKALGSAGQIFYSSLPGHFHFHTPLVASYELRTLQGGLVSRATKNTAGFCFYDSWPLNGAGEDFFPSSIACKPLEPGWTGVVRMGLSPHWGDFYNSQLADQWVDVTTAMPGQYTLFAEANPARLFDEANYGNNTYSETVTIPGGVPTTPAPVTVDPGRPATIALSGTVVGADVKSRKNANCDTSVPDCMVTANPAALSFQLAQPPAPGQGTATISGRTATFTPVPGFSGTATFAYRALDSRGLGGTATVTVTVRPKPGSPGNPGTGNPGPGTNHAKPRSKVSLHASLALLRRRGLSQLVVRGSVSRSQAGRKVAVQLRVGKRKIKTVARIKVGRRGALLAKVPIPRTSAVLARVQISSTRATLSSTTPFGLVRAGLPPKRLTGR